VVKLLSICRSGTQNPTQVTHDHKFQLLWVNLRDSLEEKLLHHVLAKAEEFVKRSST